MEAMIERVQYLIAQYQADPLRKEPRNVGVLARMGNHTMARFMGEKEDGRIDGRELRWMYFPDVYRQWVQYWREACMGVQRLEELLDLNKGNYGLVRGGKVFDTGSDSLEHVVDHLYARFVGDGFAEAMREDDGQLMADLKLTRALSEELANMNLLVAGNQLPIGIVHPVQQDRKFQINGHLSYKPEFSQENGSLYVIQTFDFVRGKPKALYEHAGASAYMYKDMIERLGKKVEAISVVRSEPGNEENEDISRGRTILEKESRIVDWNDEAARTGFLEERRQVAMG